METGFSSNTEEDIYEVEKILKKRNDPTRGVVYLVKWKYFAHSENTWEPACNFSQLLIDNYESSHKNKRSRLSKSGESSSSKTITSEDATTSSMESQMEVSRSLPRKNYKQRRQQQVELQQNIQKQQQRQQQLAVFNPIGTHSLPVVEEVIYEPELTKEPIMVTDVTAKDITVTISECKTPGNFFSM